MAKEKRPPLRPHKIVDGQAYVRSGTRWRKAVKRTCEYCGRIFYIEESSINRGPSGNGHGNSVGTYCSRAHNRLGDMKKRGYPGRTYRWCAICNRQFQVKRSKLSKIKTCGRPECKVELARRVTTQRHKEGTFNRASLRSAGISDRTLLPH